MKELKQRLEDLNFAIRMTQISYCNADAPYYKDLHLSAIEYYRAQIIIAESQMLLYANTTTQDH